MASSAPIQLRKRSSRKRALTKYLEIEATAKRRLAIPPVGIVRRTSRGVSASQTPRAIIDRTPKRALRLNATGIFAGRDGRRQASGYWRLADIMAEQ